MPSSQCDYESPISSLQFLLAMPEIHAAITFVFTSLSSYLIYHLPSYGLFSAMITLCVGLYYCRHLARGGRSAYIDAFMNAYYDKSTQITSLVRQSPTDTTKTVIIDPSTFFSPYLRPTAIITGCSSGIGLATVKQLLLMGVSCVLAVRNVDKMKQELELFFDELLKDYDNRVPKAPSADDKKSASNDSSQMKDVINNLRKMVTVVFCDLNFLLSARNFAIEVEHMNISNLAFLVNNAGAMVTRQQLISEHISPVVCTTTTTYNPDTKQAEPPVTQYAPYDGSPTDFQPTSTTTNHTTVSTELITTVDSSFTTNHLGHFLLTMLLLPTLLKHGTRVINLSSAIIFSIPPSIQVVDCLMNYDRNNTKQPSAQTQSWDAPTAYGRTKICNVWFTRSLQQRFDRLYQEVIDENTTTSRILKSFSHPQQLPAQIDENRLAPQGDEVSAPTPSSHITFASAFAVHPGTVWSPFHLPFYRETAYGLALLFPLIMLPLSFFSMKSGYYGALTTVHCAVGRHPLFSMIGKQADLNKQSVQPADSTPATGALATTVSQSAQPMATSTVPPQSDEPDHPSQTALGATTTPPPSIASTEGITPQNDQRSTMIRNMLVVEHAPSTGPQPGQMHADCRVAAISQVCYDAQKAEDLFKLSLLLCRQFINRQNYPLYNHL